MIEGSFRKVETSQKQCRNPGCHLQDEEVADEKKSTLRLCSIKTPSDLWVENNRKKSFKQPSYLVIQGQVAFNSKHPSRNGKAISFLDEKVESKVQYRIPFLGLWRQSCEQTKGQKKHVYHFL